MTGSRAPVPAAARSIGEPHTGKGSSMDVRISIVTCSDTRDISTDEAGSALEGLIREAGWTCSGHVVVPDDTDLISEAIVRACDADGADVVITCGGTGLSPRDVTPEATAAVCDRDVPGIAEAARALSLAKTRRAMLSRARCMQRGRVLVVNFPGSTRAAVENWEAVADQFGHAVKMAAGQGH